MPKFTGPLGLEFIKDRPVGTQWRVHDIDDNAITAFATEAEARAYADGVNKGSLRAPSWSFHSNDIETGLD